MITHVQYTNDTTILYPVKKKMMENWRLIILFLQNFGLKLKIAKTSIIGINVNDQRLSSYASKIGCRVEKLSFMYLGFPLDGNLRALSFWEPMIETSDISCINDL